MRSQGFKFYVNKNKLVSIGLIAFMLGSLLGGTLWHFGGIYIDFPGVWKPSSLKRFVSYEELKNFLKTNSQGFPYYYYKDFNILGGLGMRALESNLVPDYSATNIQVEGVDEMDIVKTDGEYIYLVSGKNIVILRAYPAEDAEVMFRLELNQTVRGIFVNGDKLVVFLGGFDPYGVVRWEPYYYEGERTTIQIYDISNRAAPTFNKNVTVDGNYFSSRMIDGYVYALINKPAHLQNGDVELPTIYTDNISVDIPASSIYFVNISDYYYTFTTIIAINVLDLNQNPAHETYLLGATSDIFVSKKNLYITSPEVEDITTIHKIRIENGAISYVANGNVAGYVLNQFSMDEYNGYFRVATTKRNLAQARNNVYILNTSLHIVGKLEDLAPGETIHSARFMGEKCYLVTFRKVDPLFVIDLQNPEKPQVLGKLKIPGYSDYLHPYDETHLIGVGKETVAEEGGDFSWYQGVKISLFDVSNVSNPTEINTTEIGDRGTDSPVLQDHRAFLFSPSKSLLVIPVLVAEIDETKYPNGVPPNTYGEYVWQGAYVFNISLEDGLVLKGRITHLENETDLIKSGYYFASSFSVKRTLYIGDVLYTISDQKIKMNGLESLDEINEIILP